MRSFEPDYQFTLGGIGGGMLNIMIITITNSTIVLMNLYLWINLNCNELLINILCILLWLCIICNIGMGTHAIYSVYLVKMNCRLLSWRVYTYTYVCGVVFSGLYHYRGEYCNS